MKDCKACGKELAGNARFCPECGYRFTHPFVKFLAWSFGLLFAMGVLGSMLDKSGGEQSKTSSTTQPSPQEQAKADAEKQRADAQVQGAYLGAVSLRRAMRNPESFKLTSAILMPNGVVCYNYRAQNGFGGMNQEYAVLTTKGSLSTSGGAWNKYCAHKTGEDLTAGINVQLVGLSSLFSSND